MRIRKTLTLALAAGAAALALTVPAAAAHAAPAVPAAAAAAPPVSNTAMPDTLGPGWTKIQLKAFSGGGCAGPQTDSHLSPIVSEACGTWDWYYRVIAGSTGVGYELVDSTGTFAVGFSGSPLQAKMETPNTTGGSPTILLIPLPGQSVYCDPSNTAYCNYFDPGQHGHIAPSGAGDPLRQVAGNSLPADSWKLAAA